MIFTEFKDTDQSESACGLSLKYHFIQFEQDFIDNKECKPSLNKIFYSVVKKSVISKLKKHFGLYFNSVL
jgi:hypothetical protein